MSARSAEEELAKIRAGITVRLRQAFLPESQYSAHAEAQARDSRASAGGVGRSARRPIAESDQRRNAQRPYRRIGAADSCAGDGAAGAHIFLFCSTRSR